MGAYSKYKKPNKEKPLHALMINGSPQLLAADQNEKKEVDPSQLTAIKEHTPEERKAIRVLSANTGAIILLLSGRAYPILTIPGIAMALYACMPIYKRMYSSVKAVFKERKLKNDLLNGLVVTGTLATGNVLVTAVFTFVSNLGTVVVLKSKTTPRRCSKGFMTKRSVRSGCYVKELK